MYVVLAIMSATNMAGSRKDKFVLWVIVIFINILTC